MIRGKMKCTGIVTIKNLNSRMIACAFYHDDQKKEELETGSEDQNELTMIKFGGYDQIQ